MGNGYKLDKGFLFDHSWEKQFRRLKPKDFYTLFWELYDFQRSGGILPVGEHDDNVLMSSIVTFVVPQLRNRINGARRSSRAEAGGGAVPAPLKLSEEELSQAELRVKGRARADKQGYGEFGNVFLTSDERARLTEKFGDNAEKLINIFSCKLRSKGYMFADHYATILAWEAERSERGAYNSAATDGEEKNRELEEWFSAKLEKNFSSDS